MGKLINANYANLSVMIIFLNDDKEGPSIEVV